MRSTRPPLAEEPTVHATLPAPQKTSVGWTRTADARWQRAVLERGTGARLTAAALAAFPGATVHRVVTDVLGGSEVHLVTAEGRHLVVRPAVPPADGAT
jgi:hypothetical protein